MRKDILAIIALIVVFSPISGRAQINDTVGGYCYNNCTGPGCPQLFDCGEIAFDLPDCRDAYDSTVITCRVAGTNKYCNSGTVEDACSFCFTNKGMEQEKWSDWYEYDRLNNIVYRESYLSVNANYNTCDAKRSVEYGCAAGYYTTGSVGRSDMTCSRCPDLAGLATTSSTGNIHFNGCCLEPGIKFDDGTGYGSLASKCCHS